MSGKIGNIGSKSGVVGGNTDLAPVGQEYFQCRSKTSPATAGTNQFRWDESGNQMERNNFTWDDSSNQHKIFPNSNGYFHCVWGVAFFNEPPSGAEGDAGAMYLQLNDSNITTMSLSFIVSNQNTYHEGQMWTDSRIIEITNGTGSGDYITVAHNTDWTLGNYNNIAYIHIWKMGSKTG